MTPRWLTRTIALQVPVTVAGETIEEVEIHTTPSGKLLRQVSEIGVKPDERFTVAETLKALAILCPDAPLGWVDELHPADVSVLFRITCDVLSQDWGDMGRPVQ